MTVKEWHGSDHELLRLREAVEHNCTCSRPPAMPQPACPPHAMLASQSVLDHLLYVYRSRDGFLRQEFARDA